MNYRCETGLAAIKDYLQNAVVVAFDFETAPLLQYRGDPRAALDAHRACIVGISLSVAEGSAIYIPLEHFDGGNADSDQVIPFLRDALWTNPTVTKVAHNLAFESMFLYALGIIIQPPCYDTIAAAQMTLKNSFEFRALSDSGLKKLVPELLGDELPTFEDVTGGRFFDELNSHDPETVRMYPSPPSPSLSLRSGKRSSPHSLLRPRAPPETEPTPSCRFRSAPE